MRSNFSSRCIQSGEWSHLRFFNESEFKYPQFMGYEFMLWLDKLRESIAIPITITSSFRQIEYNAKIGGAKNSAHCDIPCNAVDIGERPTATDPNWNYSRWIIVSTAIRNGCKRIGIYANGSIHLDMTHDIRPGERIWRVVGNI